ncbi:MFS transporter, partial [Streptomyces libani]
IYGSAGFTGNSLGGPAGTFPPLSIFGPFPPPPPPATLLLPLLGRGAWGALALLIVWGIAYGAVPVSSQTWFVKAAPDAPEAASVLFTASFQATISLGALAGGVALDHTSPSTVMTLGGATAVLVALTAWLHFAGRHDWQRGND